jgi:hypothetical protein
LRKKSSPQSRRFPTVPGKADRRVGSGLDVLDDVRLQEAVGHPKRLALRIEAFLAQIVAVATFKIADGAAGFNENLEIAGGFGHGRRSGDEVSSSSRW